MMGHPRLNGVYGSTSCPFFCSLAKAFRLVIRGASKEVKSKAERKAAEAVWEDVSLSDFIRVRSRSMVVCDFPLMQPFFSLFHSDSLLVEHFADLS